MHTKLRFLGTFALALTLVGCSGNKEEGDSTSTESSESTPSLDGNAGGSGGDVVVAVVNGESILKKDVILVNENMTAQGLPPDSTVGGNTLEERRIRTALKLLVEQAVVLQTAKDEGLEVSDDQVLAALADLQMRAGGADNFNAMIEARGLTPEALKRDLKNNLMIRDYVAKNVEQFPEVTEADLRSYYDRNSQQFGARPEVSAQHILLQTTPDMDDLAVAELVNKGNDIIKQLKGGADFGELAKLHSADPTNKDSGGSLGWFGKGIMVPPFDQAVFSLKVGEISDLVKTNYGYHIIRVNETREAPAMEFDAVKGQLENVVRGEMVGKATQEMVSSLREKAKIEIFDDRL